MTLIASKGFHSLYGPSELKFALDAREYMAHALSIFDRRCVSPQLIARAAVRASAMRSIPENQVTTRDHDDTIGPHNWHELKLVYHHPDKIGCPRTALAALAKHLPIFRRPKFIIGTETLSDV